MEKIHEVHLKAIASESLHKEVEDELNTEDPDKERAKAILNENTK
jgi:hypothetical protein